jgi:hypothetical protein
MGRATTAAIQVGRALADIPGQDFLQAVLAPIVQPVAQRVAGNSVQRLLGFFMLWHAYGGFQGLLDARVISQTGVYVTRKEFREVFGVDVDEFLPEVQTALAICRLAAAAVPVQSAPAPADVPAGQLELA